MTTNHQRAAEFLAAAWWAAAIAAVPGALRIPVTKRVEDELARTLDDAEARGRAEALREAAKPDCPLSERVDGPLHSWRFDGDDPYTVCVYCDQMQDARTGRVIRQGRKQ